MHSSRVFTSGNSQAVRLPKEYQVSDSELYIQRIGSSMILLPKSEPWKAFEESLSEFTEDFLMNGREQPENQSREGL